MTNVLDAETHELLLMVEGRSAAALEAFAQALVAHGGRIAQIALISIDTSPAYQSEASQFFPQAQIVFDRFHLMQMAGQAVDKVRKELARAGADLQGSLWALRGNEWTRSQEQCQQRSALCNRTPNSAGQSACAARFRTSSPRKINRPCAGGASAQSLVIWNLFAR